MYVTGSSYQTRHPLWGERNLHLDVAVLKDRMVWSIRLTRTSKSLFQIWNKNKSTISTGSVWNYIKMKIYKIRAFNTYLLPISYRDSINPCTEGRIDSFEVQQNSATCQKVITVIWNKVGLRQEEVHQNRNISNQEISITNDHVTISFFVT